MSNEIAAILEPRDEQQIELDEIEVAEQNAAMEAIATARASALAKLAALGLTADEIAAL